MIVNVALDDPAGIVTPDWTPTDGTVLIRLTLTPCGGAGLFSETVPVALFPPPTEEGSIVNEARAKGLTVRVALAAPPGAVA